MLEGENEKAIKLLDEMLSKGLKPDIYTYNAIIRGMCRKGMLDETFVFIRSLKLRDCQPDIISYNTGHF